MALKYPEKCNLPKDISLIPNNTFYCYEYIDSKFVLCQYFDFDDTKGEQNSGYCHFIGKGDWQLGIGLLWDQCKECGIKLYNEEDINGSEIS